MQFKLGKISYRTRYRSTKEMDLIFRKFWVTFERTYTEDDLSIFEELIQEDDILLYKWISGSVGVPQKYKEIISRITKEISQKTSQ